VQGPPPHHPTFAAFVTVEPTEATAEQLDPENSLLGTDIMFLTSFFGKKSLYNVIKVVFQIIIAVIKHDMKT
jgi:hypothetical protein